MLNNEKIVKIDIESDRFLGMINVRLLRFLMSELVSLAAKNSFVRCKPLS